MLAENRTLRRLGLKEVWGWPLAIFSLLFFAILSLFTDLVLTNTWDIRWVYVNLITYLEVALIGWALSGITVRRFNNERFAIWGGLILVAVLGAIKNYSVTFVSVWLGLPESSNWYTRLFGGALMGVGMFLYFSSVLGSRIEHAAAMAELSRSRAALLNHRSTAEMLVDAERERLLADTQTSLLPRLNKIQEVLTARGEKASMVSELRDLVSNHIRPLSQDLRQKAATLSAEVLPIGLSKPKYFVKYFSWRDLYVPGAPILLSFATNWIFVQIFFGPEHTWIGLLMAAVSSLFLGLLKFLIPKKRRITRAAALIWNPLLAALFSAPGFALGYFLIGDLPNRLTMLSHPVTIALTIWAKTWVDILDSDRHVSEVEAEKDNDDLKRELTLFDQQLWIARRNWSMVLHGTVQAAVTAAITRLSAADELDGYQYELVKQDLNRAREALEQTPKLDVDLQQFTNDLTATWAGICEVTWRMSERASRVLARDSSARMCVNEISKEAVSNAVRHGNASAVRIEIDRTQNELIVMQVSNNGTAPKGWSAKGVGSEMLDELTLSWSLKHDRTAGRTVLEATFPVSVGNLSAI